jgi:hypothetical protein
VRRRRDIPPPPDGEQGIANARRLIATGLWVAWQKLRVRLSRRMDPFDIETKSYKEIALENAAEALRAEGQRDDFAYPPAPEPGVDYEEVDVPGGMRQRMDARMAEVYVYEARQKAKATRRKRARRRRLVVVAATGVLGLTGVAGASALIGGTTGVPAIDKLVGLYERHRPDPSRQPARPAVRDSGQAQPYMSTAVEVPLPGAKGRSAMATAYETDGGNICIAISISRDARIEQPLGAVDCVVGREVAPAVAHEPTVIMGTMYVGSGLITGYARADVAAISGKAPIGTVDVEVSRPWLSRTPGIKPFRVFIGTTRFFGSQPPQRVRDRLIDRRLYRLTVRR